MRVKTIIAPPRLDNKIRYKKIRAFKIG